MEGFSCNLNNYCSGVDFVSAIQTISEDISVVNLPPIPKYDREDPGTTIKSLINTIWTLLQHRQQSVDKEQALEQKVYILSQELSYSKEKEKQLKISVLECEDSLIKEKKKVLLMGIENSQLLSNSKYLKEEIQELNKQMRSKDTQFKHDLQRQNNEISDLQSSLRKILSKGKGEYWKGVVDNSATFKMADNEQTKQMELLYKKSIHRLENNVHTLVKENLELRKLLENISDDLVHMMSQTNLHDNEAQPEAVT